MPNFGENMSKTLLITGATSGFGKSCAELFHQQGWKTILVGRREQNLTQISQSLGNNIHTIQLDVRNCKDIETKLNQIPDTFQNIDVLINNAGLALGLEPAHETQLEDWENMVDTNIKGVMYFTRLLLPKMVQRNSGHIINMGSIAGSWPYPGGNVYGATKAFVQQFSNNLRADLLGKNIKVTTIEPGMAETEFSLVRFKGDKQSADQVYKNVQPLTPKDIANTIYWVATQPSHVNINKIEIMPTCQAWGPLAVSRT